MRRILQLVHCSPAIALALAVTACSEQTPPSAPPGPRRGPPESVFQRERRIEVNIEMAPADWELLRFEGRSLAQLDEEPPAPYRYTGFSARVSVDGVVQDGVEVRKKGFIGSLSTLRPSLRLDFDPERQGLEDGLRRLTLNADFQDRSHARQCMALDLFAAAGVPASRCAFAHVVVNGVDLGTYSNVEPITGRMLRRFWSDDEGPLYEGTVADVDVASWQNLELESDTPTEHAELQRLAAAIEASDEALVGELEPILDLDRFRDFWAMETLLGHWDGFANNVNNYYLFLSPDSQRFQFIPWGLDQAFVGQRPFDTDFYDVTVYARSRLTRRLYDVPEQRELFRRRLGELNDQLWDEAALLAQADAIAALAPDAAPDALEAHREFLRSHGATLRAALAEPAPEIIDPPEPPAPNCPLPRSSIGGTFTTFWETQDGEANISVELDGAPVSATFYPSMMPDAADPTRATLSLYGPLDDGRAVLLLLLLPRQLITPGNYRFHGSETLGVAGGLAVDGTFTTLGLFGDGTLRFGRAGTSPSDPIVGDFQATLYQTACLGDGG
ncbi:MAG TPA: CotH kinase family protein [Polyangiaceae bacterium]|nr:CotH kinase family protein [Polyangiaceae bacterium]